MRSNLVRAAVATAALALAAMAAAAPPPRFDGPTINNPHAPPDFALRDQQQRLVRLSALRGKVVLLTFLFTHCKDVCPLTAERLNSSLYLIGAKRSQVRILAVSVDPKGDTPRSVALFIHTHRLLPQFRYLTGSRAALDTIWHAYGVQSTVRAGAGIDHTLYTLLLDRNGRGRVLYDSTARSASVAHDLRLLLATP